MPVPDRLPDTGWCLERVNRVRRRPPQGKGPRWQSPPSRPVPDQGSDEGGYTRRQPRLGG
jgi:hypothetical protein